MFTQPVNAIDTPDKMAWANYTIYDVVDGCYYSLFGTGRKTEQNPGAYPISLDVARSFDGIHWKFIVRDAIAIPGAHAGYGVSRIGEFFYYYPTCSNPDQGVHFKVYRTRNFTEWEYMGREFDVAPDRNFYHERWDEMHVIEAEEDGCTIYYGYISSETREDIGEPGVAMLKSRDGIRWQVLPPVTIEWGELPSHHMELNFVELVDGRYYLNASGRMYLDSYGYAIYTFVGDSPYGPFKPDLEMFRLAGHSRACISWLGHTLDTPDGFLVALWLSHDRNPDIPSQSFTIGPLKRLICDQGHLRLGYWQSNETAKGKALPVDMHHTAYVHPAEAVKFERDTLSILNEDSLELSASRDGGIVLLDVQLDRDRGFVIEGYLKVCENRGHIATHQHAAAAGFYFEAEPGCGEAMVADTLGVTRSGTVCYSDHKITDYNIYADSGNGMVQARSGELLGTLAFDYNDTVGPFGHASYCGVRHGKNHHFRIISRYDYFELYIDDLYVQTWLLPQAMTGRVGLMCFDGVCEYTGIKAWEMDS